MKVKVPKGKALALERAKKDKFNHRMASVMGEAYADLNKWCASFERSAKEYRRISYQCKILGDNLIFAEACYVHERDRRGDNNYQYFKMWQVDKATGEIELLTDMSAAALMSAWDVIDRMFSSPTQSEEDGDSDDN